MKGYIDENGVDRSPCGTCKYKTKMTVEAPCYDCIDNCEWCYKFHCGTSDERFCSYGERKGGDENDTRRSN